MCSQGGGVYVYYGTATFTGCYIYDNDAYTKVSLCLAHSMAPMEVLSRN